MTRVFDVVCSFCAILILTPVWLCIMLVIVLVSPGNPIYKARRVGKNGQVFTLYKFRSMRVDSGKIRATTLENDDRVFPFGRFLRKTKLDETLQFINILKGDMAIVGFRPEDEVNASDMFRDEYARILAMRPGLTSPASLYDYTHGELYEDEDAYIREVLPLKMELELYYAEKKSLPYDIRLIFRTAKIIIQKVFGKRKFAEPPEYRFAIERIRILREEVEVLPEEKVKETV